MTKVWLIGSSHVSALRRAQRDLGVQWDGMQSMLLFAARFAKSRFHTVQDGTLTFLDPSCQENSRDFRTSIASDPLDAVGVYLGDANRTLLVHSDYWRQHEPFSIVQSDRVPVPDSTLRAMLTSEARAACNFMGDLRTLGLRVFWITYPAIKPQMPAFHHGVRPEVIRHMDKMFIDQMTTALSTKGVGVIARPPESLTEQGFLKPEYSEDSSVDGGPDWVHGNVAYGGLMLDHIRHTIYSQG